jgi:hypothetical protein|tara:strand:+ start:1311 stop:1550 length:240 start_codon:yes stop_codon:yes gene_type:complete
MVETYEEFIVYMENVRENFDFICDVKSAVANEEWDLLRAIVEDAPNDVKEALNLAPSKGGIFTTHENRVMKINPNRNMK